MEGKACSSRPAGGGRGVQLDLEGDPGDLVVQLELQQERALAAVREGGHAGEVSGGSTRDGEARGGEGALEAGGLAQLQGLPEQIEGPAAQQLPHRVAGEVVARVGPGAADGGQTRAPGDLVGLLEAQVTEGDPRLLQHQLDLIAEHKGAPVAPLSADGEHHRGPLLRRAGQGEGGEGEREASLRVHQILRPRERCRAKGSPAVRCRAGSSLHEPSASKQEG